MTSLYLTCEHKLHAEIGNHEVKWGNKTRLVPKPKPEFSSRAGFSYRLKAVVNHVGIANS